MGGAPSDAADSKGLTALMHAAMAGCAAAASALLAGGAALGAKDAEGATALALAAEYGQPEVVQLLLAAGADPSAVY